ncbi:MAG: response regulator [bacterium]
MPKPEDKTVLIVDDEDDVREYFADILTDAGFNVITAADGEDALNRVRERRPDFISLDLVMPRKSGIKFLYELRHNKDWVNIPVVIVTAHANYKLGEKDLQNVLEDKSFRGPKAYLEKPIDEETYVRMVCDNVGVEYERSESAEGTDRQRSELEDLIKDADPESISDLLKFLKNKKRGG